MSSVDRPNSRTPNLASLDANDISDLAGDTASVLADELMNRGIEVPAGLVERVEDSVRNALWEAHDGN